MQHQRGQWAVALLIILAHSLSAVVAIWPRPASMTTGQGARQLAQGFKITLPGSSDNDEELQHAVVRAMKRIRQNSIVAYTPTQGAHHAELASKSSPIDRLTIEITKQHAAPPMSTRSLQEELSRQMREVSSMLFHDTSLYVEKRSTSAKRGGSISQKIAGSILKLDESYTLTIGESGAATLRADHALGVLRGLASFVQLVHKAPTTTSGVASHYITKVPLKIDDKPAFPYRSIMLDTARNYLSPSKIKAQLDAMELFKMNHFHWHITDTASWPLSLQTKNLGLLAAKGAYSTDMTYDPQTIKELVHYAAERGISIVLEIDMPGHQYMGVAQYPGDLITCGAEKNWTAFGAEPPTGHLDIRKPAAIQLMKDILTELATYLPGQYFSTGNDEVEATCYGLAKGDKAGTDKLLAPFVDAVHSHLITLGKTPVVWEEAVLNFPETARQLKKGTIVEAWTTSANVEKILQSNADTYLIHAPSDFFYLDCGMGSFLGNWPGGSSWCTYVTWQKQYSFDPYNGTEKIAGGKERVLGGESALWAEQVDEANVESLLWPRAAAGAEVFWTGPEYTANGEKHKRSVADALPRLHEARGRLRSMGVLASPLQPQWCALRPGACDMMS